MLERLWQGFGLCGPCSWCQALPPGWVQRCPRMREKRTQLAVDEGGKSGQSKRQVVSSRHRPHTPQCYFGFLGVGKPRAHGEKPVLVGKRLSP